MAIFINGNLIVSLNFDVNVLWILLNQFNSSVENVIVPIEKY